MPWLVLATGAHAGSLNAWGPAVGDDSVAVMPFASADGDGQFSQVYAALGSGDRFDLNVGAGTVVGWSGGTASTLELLPRVFVAEALGFGAHLLWTPGTEGVVVGPEAHGEWSAGSFTFGANLGWTPRFGRTQALGDVWAVLAPEVWLTDRWSVFCEVDPTVPVAGGRPEVQLVPGVGAVFDDQSAHAASLGLGVVPGPTVGWNLGVAWTSVFTITRRAASLVADGEAPTDQP